MMAITVDSEQLLIVIKIDERIHGIGNLWSEIRLAYKFIRLTPHSHILRLINLPDILRIIDRSHDLTRINSTSSRRASIFKKMSGSSHASSDYICSSCVRIIHEILKLWWLHNHRLNLIHCLLFCFEQKLLQQMMILH